MALDSVHGYIPLNRGFEIDRPRLRERLELATRYALTLVTAPSGYGKTILAAQFGHRSPYPVVWHSVEERERDVPNLYAHCIKALSGLLPQVNDLSPRKRCPPEELACLVTDALREYTDDTLVYILDDAHNLVGSPGAVAWLGSFIANLPSWCHLILVSRVVPDLPIADMIARQEVLALGHEQLRFNLEETSWLAEKIGTGFSENKLQELTTRLAGWPAGVMLALQPLPAEVERVLFKGAEGPEALFDKLAELMLNAQPSPMRTFLLAASILSQMTPDLCTTVLQLPDSSEYFTVAIKRNIFLSEMPGGLTFHPLFRDFLQRQLLNSDRSLYLELHSNAARWFEDNNQLENAFEHYLSAERPGRAAAIAERAAHAYFSQGKIETLLNWQSRLQHVLTQVPKLAYCCAMVHTNRYQYDLAVAELTEAEQGFQNYGDKVGLIEAQLLSAFIDDQRGNYQRAVDVATRIAAAPETPPNLRGYALHTLGIAMMNLGETHQALGHLESALPLHKATGDSYAISQLLQQLEVGYLLVGRFDEAAACLQEVVAIQRSFGSATGLAMALNNLGCHYQFLGDYQQAHLTLQEGLSVASRTPENRAESYLLSSMGDLLRDRGSFADASQLYYKTLEIIGNGEPLLRCNVITGLCILERWRGNLSAALSLADEAVALADKHGATVEKMKSEVALWATRAKQGDFLLAREQLDKLANQLQQRKLYPQLAQAWGLCAYTSLLCSDTALAREYLTAVTHTITHHANLQSLIAEIMHTPLLKKFVIRYPMQYSNLNVGLKRLEEAQLISAAVREPISSTPASPIYSLRVWCLGQERIERDGIPVVSSDWQATMARELFLYLLFKGASTRELISLAFWPDESPRHVRSNFHTTLHRARHAVGANTILFQDDLYFVNPEINLWCDVRELQALVQQAKLLPPRTAHTENLWRRALALYQGEFLPFTYAEWAMGLRTTLQETYLEALVGMANATRARGDHSAAIGVLKRALEIDPFREDIHRSILICHAEQGERGLVLEHLANLKQLLRRDLGIPPSEETLSLAAKLLEGTSLSSTT